MNVQTTRRYPRALRFKLRLRTANVATTETVRPTTKREPRIYTARTEQRTELRTEQGSVLPLLPVLIIICFLLGTLSVSTASTFLAKRELYNAAAAAANDAVSGIDDEKYFGDSVYVFDPINAQKLAIQSVKARVGDTLRLREQDIKITVDGERIRVSLEADFSPVFRGFLPGGLKKTRLKATALAEARTTP
jgi:malate synthase